MTNPFALPLLGGSLLAAVAAGIHLGESAVAMIDPVHFRGPAVHPRDRGAAIDERELLAARSAPPRLYGWEEGHAARARAADCGDCEAIEVRDAKAYSAVVPYFGGRGAPEDTKAPVEPRTMSPVRVHRGSDHYVEEEQAFAEMDRSPQRRIERYAHFPLGYEEAAFSGPLSESRPVEDKDAFH